MDKGSEFDRMLIRELAAMKAMWQAIFNNINAKKNKVAAPGSTRIVPTSQGLKGQHKCSGLGYSRS